MFFTGLSVWDSMCYSQKGQDVMTTSAPVFSISALLSSPKASASAGFPDFTPPPDPQQTAGISIKSTTFVISSRG